MLIHLFARAGLLRGIKYQNWKLRKFSTHRQEFNIGAVNISVSAPIQINS